MMVGNDIIDIRQTKLSTNWKRKGFLQKVFTTEEQAVICNVSDSFAMVWRMWSMKESAYKLYLQQDKERFFNPSKISCSIISGEKGEVCIDGLKMKTHTEISSTYIFTTATLGDLEGVENSIFYLSSDDARFQSEVTHQKMRHHVAMKNRFNIDLLQIRKTSQNIPQLFYEEQKLDISFSLSHHGHYGAFSIFKQW